MENIFTDNWEQRLETMFLKKEKGRRRAYICSPLSAENDSDFLANMHTARAYMLYAYEKMNLSAKAPHAFLPMMLCDRFPLERDLAIEFGLSLVEYSTLILICGNRLSSGMKGEIAHAASFHIPMVVFDEGLYSEVKKELIQYGKEGQSIILDQNNPVMGSSSPILYLENAAVFK